MVRWVTPDTQLVGLSHWTGLPLHASGMDSFTPISCCIPQLCVSAWKQQLGSGRGTVQAVYSPAKG